MSDSDLLSISQESRLRMLDVALKIQEAFSVGAHVSVGVALDKVGAFGVGFEIVYKTGDTVRRFLSGREGDLLGRLMRETRAEHGGIEVPGNPEATKRANNALDRLIETVALSAKTAQGMALSAATVVADESDLAAGKKPVLN